MAHFQVGGAAPRSMSTGVALGAFALALVLGYLYWSNTKNSITSQNAQVEGTSFVLRSQVAGTIAKLPFPEGSRIEQGALVVQLDTTPFQNALDDALRSLAAVQRGEKPLPSAALAAQERRATDTAATQARQKRHGEELARKHMEHWTAEHTRIMVALRNPQSTQTQRQKLGQDELNVRGELDKAKAALEDLSRERANADAAFSRLNTSSSTQQLSSVQWWQNRLIQAQQELAATTVLSQVSGWVNWLPIQVGQEVPVGETLAIVLPLENSNFWVWASFSKRQMLTLRPGLRCQVEFPQADPPLHLEGVIANLQPDAEGAMARINLEMDDAAHAMLYPGMAAVVRVRVGS